MIKLAAEPIIAKSQKSNSWYFRIKYFDDDRFIDKRKQGFSTKREAKLAAAEFEAALFQPAITDNDSITISSQAKKDFVKPFGHSDVTQTLNTYSHLMPNVQKQIINALDFEM